MKEIWVSVIGLEGHLEVSSSGNFRAKSGTFKKQYMCPKGYLTVNVLGKNYRAHRLVLASFRGFNEEKPVVNHINAIRSDNRLGNLEWCTQSENVKHTVKMGRHVVACKKLDDMAVLTIKTMLPNNKWSLGDIAKHFNVSKDTIYSIYRGFYWNHIPNSDVPTDRKKYNSRGQQ